MAFRWFDSSEPVAQLRPQRQAFHDRTAARIEENYPGATEAMRRWWSDWLQATADCDRELVKVDDLGPVWEGTPFQHIYDTLEDWNESRWFAGVQLMLVVIEHKEYFCAYKAEEESSTVYFRDNIHYKHREQGATLAG